MYLFSKNIISDRKEITMQNCLYQPDRRLENAEKISKIIKAAKGPMKAAALTPSPGGCILTSALPNAASKVPTTEMAPGKTDLVLILFSVL